MQQKSSVETDARRMANELRQSCVGVRVGRLSRLIGRRYEQALRPVGISVAQMEILGALVLNPGPQRPADLASWLDADRSTMSRNLALMEQRGYIETTETSPTGRSQRVSITVSGATVLASAERTWQAVQHDVSCELGTEVVPTLDTWLAALGAGAPGARRVG